MPGVPPRIAAAWRPVSMPSPAASTTASRTDGSPMNRASSPIAFEPPPTQAMREIRQPPLDGRDLRRRLVADPALEVAHDRRVRVRAHRRTQDVVGRLDVRHPVAHRLVDRVLERRGAGRHRADLGAQGAHPQHVRALPLDVLGAHVDDARQVEQRAGRGGRDAVLAGAGLGDHPGLAEPPGEQRLAQRVVDLVRAGVGEVLALEVEAEVRDARRAEPRRRRAAPPRRGRPRPGDRHGTRPSGARRSGRAARAARPRRPGPGGARRRPSRAARARPSASRGRSDHRSRAPSPTARRRRRRAGRRWTGVGPKATFGRSSRAARARLTNSATRSGSFRGRSPGTRGRSTPDATSTPVAGTARSAPATLAGSRPPARVTGTSRATAAASRSAARVPVPPGCASARGVEEEPLDAGVEIGPAARHEIGDDRGDGFDGSAAGRWRTFQVRRGIAPRRLDRFGAAELDDVGVERGDDPFEALGATRRR